MKNKSKPSFIQHKIYSTMMNSCIALALFLGLGLGQLQAAPEAESITTQPKADEAKWFTDFEAAKKLAAKENRPILMFFTGSDWCAPCKQFKTKTLETELFLNAAKNNWVLVEVDLPKDKSKLSEETLNQNKLLQDYFEIVGFPTVLILSSDSQPLAKALKYYDPKPFLEKLTPYIETNKKFTQHINNSLTLEGKAKAQELLNALNLVAKDSRRFHAESIKTLRKLNNQGDADVANSLLASLETEKDSMADDLRDRVLDLESEFAKQGRTGWLEDLEAAKAKAAKEGKYVYVHFLQPVKSDAKLMLNRVFYQPEFKARTSKDWILLELKCNWSPKEVPQYSENNKTAKLYKIHAYPTMAFCIFPDGKPFSTELYMGKYAMDLEGVLSRMEANKKIGDEIISELKRAEKTTGAERAVIINKALLSHYEIRLSNYNSSVQAKFRDHYSSEIQLLLEADPESNQKLTKLIRIENKKHTKKTQAEIGELAERYFKEHSEIPLRTQTMLYKKLAYSYAYQGNKAKAEEALALLLRGELVNAPNNPKYSHDSNVKTLRTRIAQTLAAASKQ